MIGLSCRERILIERLRAGVVTYRRSGPVEADSACNDPLVGGKGRQQEIGFCLSLADSQRDSLEKVVDAEGQDYEKSSRSGLNERFAELSVLI